MKKPTTILRLGLILCAVLVLNACQKEVSQSNNQSTEQTERSTGALPDNPSAIAQVPVIMSPGFMTSNRRMIQSVDLSVASRGGKPKAGTDITAPVVSITSPANGSNVSGAITVQVSASDNVGVASVSLAVDGTIIKTLTASPYSFSWTSDGNAHTLTATAKDAAGNSASASITTANSTVSGDNTPPTVNITSPANGATVSGTVSISVSASDNVGVSSVSLSVDGNQVSTLNASPYNFSWDATTVADGTHTLTATAKDAAGNVNTSSITIAKNTVINTISPTTLPSSLLLAMPPVGYQGGEGCCVAFAVAYAARSCEQYYRSNATSFSYTTNIFSPEYVFDQTQAGGCSGASLLTSLDLIVNKGVCTWGAMPYDYTNGCSLQPTSSENAEASNFRITSYSKVYTTDMTAMKTVLNNKHPLMMTFANDNNFNNAGPGYIWKSYDYSGGFGSHAITICGYDDSKHAYKAINSWGTSWGDAGYIWIDYDFLPTVASTVYCMN